MSREDILKKLEELSSGSEFDFVIKAATRLKLYGICRESNIEYAASELFPIQSNKDIIEYSKREGWILGYEKALDDIREALSDEKFIDLLVEENSKLYYLGKIGKREEEKDNEYEKIFKHTISALLREMKKI